VSASRARVTLADVASQAGTSASTASRVLHGGAGVSEELSARVREVAARLGYSVNRQARSLRRGRDEAIGVALEDFTIPFFGRVVSVVERVAHERGYGVVITCAGPGRSEEEAVEPLLSRSVAGLVVATGTAGAPEGYLAEVARDLPVVAVDAAGPSPVFDSVGIDNRAAGRAVAAHVVSRGHREVLFVGSGPAASTVVQRRAGYEEVMRAAGLVPRAADLGYLPGPARGAALEVLRAAPEVTAVVSGVARSTMGALSALAALGRRDVAFAAIDDLAGLDALSPGVTVFEQDVEGLSERAAELLFERIDGRTGPPRHVELPLRLVERGSGELPPPASTAPPPAPAPRVLTRTTG
jgi:LacI family transcriptional regulator